jgi:hypothetical protein
VHEHIFAAVITNDEAEALLCVEELYDASRFADNLGGHAAAAAPTAAEATAAATTEAATATEAAASAAAIPAAAAKAAAVTAAESTTIFETAAEAAAAEVIVAETIALVPAAPTALSATSSIETHALFVFPVRPEPTNQNLSAGRKTQVLRH